MITSRVANTPALLRSAFAVRHTVFVEEQKVPVEMEKDEFDASAVHVIALDGKTAVGTGRLVIEGTKGHIGRVAVLQANRGSGVGKNIMIELENKAKELNLVELYLHAQTHAMKFYERLGYLPRGEKFDEAGIEHIEMYKLL